jgi:hypothetical protein
MAPLFGRLFGDPHRKQVTRVGHESVESRMETWSGGVRTVLFRDGSYRVFVGGKYDANNVAWGGKVEV